MSKQAKRKCRYCGQYFEPDFRNATRQKYCSDTACRKASKSASQRRWLRKPENRDYFRGPEHVQRAQEWRRMHPKRSARNRAKEEIAPSLQDDCHVQPFDNKTQSVNSTHDSTIDSPLLQEIINAQPLVIYGLIAHLTGSLLQDDIARSSRSFIQLGQDILSTTLSTQGDRNYGAAHSSPRPSAPRASPL